MLIYSCIHPLIRSFCLSVCLLQSGWHVCTGIGRPSQEHRGGPVSDRIPCRSFHAIDGESSFVCLCVFLLHHDIAGPVCPFHGCLSFLSSDVLLSWHQQTNKQMINRECIRSESRRAVIILRSVKCSWMQGLIRTWSTLSETKLILCTCMCKCIRQFMASSFFLFPPSFQAEMTPIGYSTRAEQPTCLKMLVERGANPHLQGTKVNPQKAKIHSLLSCFCLSQSDSVLVLLGLSFLI